MKSLAMLVALAGCAMIQALLPAWTAMGQAKAPLLLGATLYYALYHERRLMLQGAIIAGLFQDALGMIPLGYSSFCFCVVGLLLARFKEVIFVQEWMTHALVGALASAAVVLMLYVLLAHDTSIAPRPTWLMLKVMGSLLLGAATVPFVFAALSGLDRRLGNVEPRRV